MTRQEELTYLFGILSEASKWTASPDDNRDLVRMEVEERIHNLINGVEPEPDENGLIQSSIHPDKPGEFVDTVEEPRNEADYKAIEAAKPNEHLASPDKAAKVVNEWKAKRVRCQENGHPVWHLRSECVKEPRDNRNGGPKWTWKWIGPQDKKKQEDVNKLSDELWEAHENGNDL